MTRENEYIDVWRRIVNKDDNFAPDYNAKANTRPTDTGYAVDWFLNAVGLVKTVEFDTLADAYDWLEAERFENYTA